MSEDLECVNFIQSTLSMESQWSYEKISDHIDNYMMSNDINQNSANGFSPLFTAASMGDIRVVEVLLERGANPNLRNIYSHSPLFIAAEKGDLGVIKILTDYGANVDLQDQLGRTPIMIAADNGHVKSTKFLVDQSENINLKDGGKNTVLHYAFKALKKDVIKHLMDKGADMSIKNNYGVSGDMIKKDIINRYNKIKNRKKQEDISVANSLSFSPSGNQPKKQSTKFRDIVEKSRQKKPSKGFVR